MEKLYSDPFGRLVLVLAGDLHYYHRCVLRGVLHVVCGSGGAFLHLPHFADSILVKSELHGTKDVTMPESKAHLEYYSWPSEGIGRTYFDLIGWQRLPANFASLSLGRRVLAVLKAIAVQFVIQWKYWFEVIHRFITLFRFAIIVVSWLSLVQYFYHYSETRVGQIFRGIIFVFPAILFPSFTLSVLNRVPSAAFANALQSAAASPEFKGVMRLRPELVDFSADKESEVCSHDVITLLQSNRARDATVPQGSSTHTVSKLLSFDQVHPRRGIPRGFRSSRFNLQVELHNARSANEIIDSFTISSVLPSGFHVDSAKTWTLKPLGAKDVPVTGPDDIAVYIGADAIAVYRGLAINAADQPYPKHIFLPAGATIRLGAFEPGMSMLSHATAVVHEPILIADIGAKVAEVLLSSAQKVVDAQDRQALLWLQNIADHPVQPAGSLRVVADHKEQYPVGAIKAVCEILMDKTTAITSSYKVSFAMGTDRASVRTQFDTLNENLFYVFSHASKAFCNGKACTRTVATITLPATSCETDPAQFVRTGEGFRAVATDMAIQSLFSGDAQAASFSLLLAGRFILSKSTPTVYGHMYFNALPSRRKEGSASVSSFQPPKEADGRMYFPVMYSSAHEAAGDAVWQQGGEIRYPAHYLTYHALRLPRDAVIELNPLYFPSTSHFSIRVMAAGGVGLLDICNLLYRTFAATIEGRGPFFDFLDSFQDKYDSQLVPSFLSAMLEEALNPQAELTLDNAVAWERAASPDLAHDPKHERVTAANTAAEGDFFCESVMGDTAKMCVIAAQYRSPLAPIDAQLQYLLCSPVAYTFVARFTLPARPETATILAAWTLDGPYAALNVRT